MHPDGIETIKIIGIAFFLCVYTLGIIFSFAMCLEGATKLNGDDFQLILAWGFFWPILLPLVAIVGFVRLLFGDLPKKKE